MQVEGSAGLPGRFAERGFSCRENRGRAGLRGALVRAALLLGFAAGAIQLAGCQKASASADSHARAPQAREVNVVRVGVRTLTGQLRASGLLVSREEADVGSELTGYRVAAVFVEQGATVAKGQPLAQLDDALLRSQVLQQRAILAEQQVAAKQAADQAARVKGLDNQGVLSEEQIVQRRFAAASAQAASDAAAAQLADLETREARMVIRAPVAGLVFERNVHPGDVTGGGATPMFRIARDSLVELAAEVPEADLSHIHAGDPAQVVLPDAATISGVVRLVDPTIDAQTKLGKVRIRLPVRPDLRPGGFGRATFSSARRDVVSVPETAVRYDADGASVMVVGPDDRVRQVSVRTGERSAGFVELVTGPAPGTPVVLGAAVFVLPGDRVRPIEVQSRGVQEAAR